MIDRNVRLLRGFAVDFLTAHNPEAARVVMSPRYCLSIGGIVLDGREEAYLPATVAQLDQFPGLCVTAHDTVIGTDAVALRFTEHGVSAKNGRVSTWGGITLFQIADGQLRNGWAEEDYYARKRQLKSGVPDEIRPPHHAPWDKTAEAHDSQTEVMVRAWLADTAHLLDLIDEISAEGPRLAELIRPEKIRLSFLFTAGHRAAFHGEIEGVYTGGFSDIDRTMISTPVRLPIAAIVDIAEAQVYRVQLCGDRLGLHRSLLPSR